MTKVLIVETKNNKICSLVELVLVGDKNIIKYLNIHDFNENIKPIFISKYEKIEVGDWKYAISHDGSEQMNPVQLIYKCEHLEGEIEGFKVIVLPEQFTSQHLQQIVDGELKEGVSYLLECEDLCDYEGEEIWEITPDYQIKLPLTIYKEEEKMYSREQLEKAWNAGFERGRFIENGEGFSYREPLIKKEWFEQNIK